MESYSELDRQKEETIERLASAYARDEISMEVYEELTERIQAAPDLASLDATCRSLPIPVDPPPNTTPHPQAVDPGEKIVTILSDRKLSGNWIRGRNATCFTILGSTTLDLRDTELRQHPHVHVVSLMGTVTIRLPSTTRVNSSITPVLGETSKKGRPARNAGPDEVTLTGVAIMSEVKVRYG